MIKPDTFSAYMLKAFDECPQKYFYLYVKKINLPFDKKLTQLGDTIHKLANFYLKNQDTSRMEKALNEQENDFWTKFKNLEILKKELLYSEYNFCIREGNFWLNGRIDAIFQDREKIIIADWKTGEEIDIENDYQSKIYLLAVWKIFNARGRLKNPQILEFHYIYLKNSREQIIKFDESKLVLFKEIICAKMNKIDKLDLTEPNKAVDFSQCYTCNFKSICYNYRNSS